MGSTSRSSHQRCSIKKLFLKISQYCQESPVLGSLFNKVAGLKACNFIEETPTQVVFCEYCEIFKNTYFEEHLQMAASEPLKIVIQ